MDGRMDVPERAAICVKDSPCIRFSFSRLILRRSFLSFLVFLPHFRRYMSDTEDAKVAKLPVSALVFFIDILTTFTCTAYVGDG